MKLFPIAVFMLIVLNAALVSSQDAAQPQPVSAAASEAPASAAAPAPAPVVTPAPLAAVSDLAQAEELLKKQLFEKAKESLLTYIANNPNDPKAWEMLRQIHSSQYNVKLEVEALEKLVELVPANKKYIEDAIALYRDMGNKEKQCKFYEKFIALKLDAADRGKQRVALDELAAFYEAANRADDLYRILKELTLLAPRNENYQFKKGVIDFNKQSYEPAYAAFKATSDISPSFNAPKFNYYFGESAFQVKQWAVAAARLDKALSDMPGQAELYAHMGQAYEAADNPEKAAQAYEFLFAREPRNKEYLQKLISLYEAQKDDFRLIKLYEAYQELNGRPDLDISVKQAKILSQTNPSKAITVYEEILAADSKNAAALSALVDLYDAKNEKPRVQQYLVQLMQVAPTADGSRRLATMYLEQKDTLKAIEPLERFTQSKPDDLSGLFLLGKLYLATRQDDRGAAALGKIIEAKPEARSAIEPGALYNAYGMALSRLGRKDEAVAAYEIAVKANAMLVDAWLYLAGSYLEKEQWPNAIDALTRVKAFGAQTEKANKGLAKAYFLSKNYRQAMPFLEKMLKDDPDNKDLIVKLATACLELKQTDRAADYLKALGASAAEKEFAGNVQAAIAFTKINNDASARTLLKQALERNPAEVTALRMLADIEVRAKSYGEAVRVLESLYGLSGDIKVKKEQGNLQVQLGDDHGAAQSFETVLQKDKSDRAVLDSLLSIYVRLKNVDKAYPILADLVKMAPRNENYLFKKGQIEFMRNDFKSAAASFSVVRSVNSKYEKLAYYLGESQFNAGNFAGAEEPLSEAVQAEPGNADLLTHLATAYDKGGKAAKAAEVYEKLYALKPSDNTLLERLIAIYEPLRNNARLADLYTKRMAANGKDRPTLLKLADIYRSQKDFDDAIKAYEDVLDMDPTNMMSLTSLVDLYEAKKDLKKAAEKLELVIGLKPEAALNLRLATMYLVMADSAKAIAPLERIVALNKTAVRELMNLGLCYMTQKDYPKAEMVFRKVMEQKLQPGAEQGRVWLAYAVALEGNGKIGESIAAYEQAVKFDSKNGNAYLKMGRYYLNQKQWGKALQPLLTAKSLKVNEAECAAGLADAYYNAGKLKEALPYLEQSNVKNPGQTETLERLVNVYMTMNDNVNAVKCLNELNKKDPSRFGASYLAAAAYVLQGDDRSAEPVLVKYTEKNPKDVKALRMLADLYKRQNSATRASEILERLFALTNNTELKKEIGGLMAKTEPEVASAAYEVYVKSQPKDKAVLEALLGIYESKGNAAAQYPVLEKLIAVDARNASYLSKKGEVDFAAKRYKDAVSCFLGVRALSPGDLRSAFVLGESYYALSDFAKAEPFLSQAVSQKPEDMTLRLHLAQV
ncbi:MAG: tetratricopeptide repeat protein, partial [Fibrobacterota bacterium]